MGLDELDSLAAEKVMGWHPCKLWQPTRNIAHAWELLEKFERYTVMTWDFDREIGNQTNFRAIIGVKNQGHPIEVFAETAPLAITKACLKAVGENVE